MPARMNRMECPPGRTALLSRPGLGLDGSGEPSYEEGRLRRAVLPEELTRPCDFGKLIRGCRGRTDYFFRLYVIVNIGSFASPTYMAISIVSSSGILFTDFHLAGLPSIPG